LPNALEDKWFIFQHENMNVKVIFTRDLEKVQVAGKTLGPIEAGREVELPFWQAKILVDEGYAKYTEEINIDPLDIRKMIMKEYNSPKIEPIDKHFYYLVKRELESLKSEYKTNPMPALSQKISQIETIMQDLISLRLAKIVKIALKGAKTNFMNNMSIEEAWLYNRLKKLLERLVSQII